MRFIGLKYKTLLVLYYMVSDYIRKIALWMYFEKHK